MKVTTELYCSICMNDENGDWTSLIPCGHLFHEQCVRTWCNPPPPKAGEKKTKKPDWCPLCRSKILRPIEPPPGKKKIITKENSRFRKIIFPNEVKIDLSSSPARTQVIRRNSIGDSRGEGTSAGNNARNRRGGLVIDSSDDEILQQWQEAGDVPARDTLEDGGGEAILTESESDEENARPARPVYPRHRQASTSYNNGGNINNVDNATLGEARATIARKNEELAQLRQQLTEARAEVASTLEGANAVAEEAQIIEARLKEKLEEIKKLNEEIRKLKEDKRGLSKSIKVEVEKVGELSKTNKKLIEEITLLKDKYSRLKHDHDQLESSYNTTTEDYQSRLETSKQAEETYKDRFARVYELNKVHERKLNLKRERIKALEAELAKHKNAEEAKRKFKGKGRAVDVDGEQRSYDIDEGTSLAVPTSRSRQVSNKSIDDTSYMAELPDEDFEESLLVTEVPDSEGHEVYQIGDDDEDAFADLDIVLAGPKPSKRPPMHSKPVLSRDPLKEWTNSEKGKSTSRERQSSASGSSNAKKRSLTSITSASDKWADMALLGTGKNGKGSAMAHGDKKKAKTAF